ncbi:MAG: hypothetical protein Sapg2KO_01150 [Saprospiraceae bacterium]
MKKKHQNPINRNPHSTLFFERFLAAGNRFFNSLPFFENKLGALKHLRILLFLYLLIPQHVEAKKFDGSTDWDVTYDVCDGYVEIEVLILNTDGCDDWMSQLFISYINTAGEDVRFFELQRSGKNEDFDRTRTGGLEQGGVEFNYRELISGTSVRRYTPEGQNDLKGVKVRLNNLPNEVIKGGAVKIKAFINWVETSPVIGICTSDGSTVFEDFEKTEFTTSINTPTNLEATLDEECGGVTIKWDNPTNISNACGGSADWKVEVYRDDRYIGEGGKSGTLFDEGATKGVEHTYKVRSLFEPNTNLDNYSDFTTTPVKGKRIGPLAAPTGVSASNDRCDEKVLVTWSGVAGNKGYEVRRRSSRNSRSFTSFAVAEGERSIENTPPSTNRTYFYSVIAINECGDYSPESTKVEGSAPGSPSAPSGIDAEDDDNGGVLITWDDNSNNETGFLIERFVAGGGSPRVYEVGAGEESFTDMEVNLCEPYTYLVRAVSDCYPDGIGEATAEVILAPDLDNTFPAGAFDASKGYFSDKVELTWTNNNDNLINKIKIERRQLGSGDSFKPIESDNSGSGIFPDVFTQAGVLYEYKIFAEGLCDNETIKSNELTAVGFRSNIGRVNGEVSFGGRSAVKDVIVSAEGSNAGQNLDLDKSSYLTIADDERFDETDELLVEAWFKLDNKDNGTKFFDRSGAFSLDLFGNNLRFAVTPQSGMTQPLFYSANNIPVGQYVHLAGQLVNDSLQLYVNGEMVASRAIPAGFQLRNGSSNITIGQNLNGKVDEIRIWNQGKSQFDISRDYSRLMVGDEEGLISYLRLDEGFQNFAYDVSRVGLSMFNKNDARIIGTANWTRDIPNADQLGIRAYTDSLGSYQLVAPYNGIGETFTITPRFKNHQFDPNQTLVFLGDGASIQNNIDFDDVSFFEINGIVLYDGGLCPAAGVSVKVDGELQFNEAREPIQSDAEGEFTVLVPIGRHFISLEKDGHIFSRGRYPATAGELENFQAPLPSPIIFEDSTYRKVVGRVVGGLLEGNKKLGLGLSKNNIGITDITFQSNLKNGCSTVSVATDNATGEYEVHLLPIEYTIESLRLRNDKDGYASTPNGAFENALGDKIDLSNVNQLIMVKDTTLGPGGEEKVDSASYHAAFKVVHRNNPTIEMKGDFPSTPEGDSVFIGDRELQITDAIKIPLDQLTLGEGPIPFPVFTQGKTYRSKIFINEIYRRYDDNGDLLAIDNTPSIGKLTINNEFDAQSYLNTDIPIDNGRFSYTFAAGDPTLSPGATSLFDFTQKIELDFESDGVETVSYLPVPAISGFNGGKKNPYRAYVKGGVIEGAGFTVAEPATVDLILRNPPGSNSYATWSKDSTFTKATVTSESWNHDINESAYGQLGFKFTFGTGLAPGPEVDFDQFGRITANFSQGVYLTDEGEAVETFTASKSLTTSTSANPKQAGGKGDLMVGTSSFKTFGEGKFFTTVDTALCSNPLVNCFGEEFDGYRLGFKPGIVFLPDSGLTEFIFKVFEIETLVIPNLEKLRNDLFVSQPDIYVSNVSMDHLEFNRVFGSNNDDPHAWTDRVSTDDPLAFQEKDTTGLSYTFYQNKKIATRGNGIDSIRIYNAQIRQWKLAMARNEKAKYDSYNEDNVKELGNYSIGTAALDLSFTTTTDTTFANTFETQFMYGGDVSFQFLINNNGAGGNAGYSYTDISGKTESQTTTLANTFNYHIEDQDIGDLINVTVVDPGDGNGAIFRVNGGETSCPYIDAEVMRYFDKNYRGDLNEAVFSSTYLDRPDNTYSPRTVQRDVPKIAVSGEVRLDNIPAGEPAVFQLVLSNESESEDSREYELVVANNPNGAIIEIDGLDPNRKFTVPYAFQSDGSTASLIKTLTLRRGATHFDHENIKLILRSPCDPLTIFDEITIEAHFTPVCTEATLYDPANNWVINSVVAPKDTPLVPILIRDYDYNFSGFKYFEFQYKQSNEDDRSWNTAATFHKDSSEVLQVASNFLIPQNSPLTLYDWNVAQLVDGDYELRVQCFCDLPGHPNTKTESEPNVGIMDRLKPHPFGRPSPADGILDPNDEISIRFNEPIDLGTLLKTKNFDIRGVTNGTKVDHSTSLLFDGTDDFVEVPGGAALNNRDFTIEFSAKRSGQGEEVLLSQGTDENAQFSIGFDADDRLFFKIGQMTVRSDEQFEKDIWSYFAVSYYHESDSVRLYAINEKFNKLVNPNDLMIFVDYEGSGPLLMGKNSATNGSHFHGNMHEIRIWANPKSLNDFSASRDVLLSGNELGLLFNWRMDEAEGEMIKEYVRRRDGFIDGSIWQVDPNGFAATFDGMSHLKAASGKKVITNTMDFTLEFWFNSSQTGVATLFSNGSGSLNAPDSSSSWLIQKDAENKIRVLHHGINFEAVSNDYFDGQWHHFALVMRRDGSISGYINGNLENSQPAQAYQELSGPFMYIGAKGMRNLASMETISEQFVGQMDEFRFWNTARTLEQIRRDKQNRMKGDEPALIVYLPFENYTENEEGIADLDSSFVEQIDTVLIEYFGVILKDETPTIKLQRPVQKVNFDFSVNNDQIIFTPTVDPELIENVTLDITVELVQDLQGNIMESPRTWIAYVDQNQVVWQDDLFNFSKKIGEELQFSSAVVNQGGEAKMFQIENIPEWLTVIPSSGTIAPNSVLQVNFEVDPLINIGDYIQDILLLTDFGFPEKLSLDLKVRDQEPDWKVDPSDFEYSMSIVGQLKIDNIISSDSEDILAAFVGDEVRGRAYLRYISALDKHLVFLDVYSNVVSEEELNFKIWDASEGIIYTQVMPASITFNENTFLGSLESPQLFEANQEIAVDVPLNAGWNWICYFLEQTLEAGLDESFKSLNPQMGYLVKSNASSFAEYSPNGTWEGPLDSIGLQAEQMYKLKATQKDTLRITGNIINPLSRTINLNNNWNWLGFISIRNQSVQQALGDLDPADGDLIKGKTKFAVYDTTLQGWIGSLETMEPGAGYMYKSIGEKSFTFPLSGLFRNKPPQSKEYSIANWKVDHDTYASNMTLVSQVQNNCGFSIPKNTYAIGVFDTQDAARAISPLEATYEDVGFLTVMGDQSEDLEFRLLNLDLGLEYSLNQTLAYQVNKHIGTSSAPFSIGLNEEVCSLITQDTWEVQDLFKVFPAVFDREINVSYQAELDDDKALWMLYNAQGKLLRQSNIGIRQGRNRFQLDMSTSLMEGVYFFVLQTNGQRETAKIIKH